jgi:hypothetical protein
MHISRLGWRVADGVVAIIARRWGRDDPVNGLDREDRSLARGAYEGLAGRSGPSIAGVGDVIARRIISCRT